MRTSAKHRCHWISHSLRENICAVLFASNPSISGKKLHDWAWLGRNRFYLEVSTSHWKVVRMAIVGFRPMPLCQCTPRKHKQTQLTCTESNCSPQPIPLTPLALVPSLFLYRCKHSVSEHCSCIDLILVLLDPRRILLPEVTV